MLHFHTPGHHILNNHAPFSLQMIEQQRAKYYITATKYDGRLTALRKKQTAYAKLVWDTILHLAYLRNPYLSYPSINDGNTCIIRKHSTKRRGLLIQTLYLRYLHQQTGLKLRVGSSCSMNERMIEKDLIIQFQYNSKTLTVTGELLLERTGQHVLKRKKKVTLYSKELEYEPASYQLLCCSSTSVLNCCIKYYTFIKINALSYI